jgi:hypothetical protein
MQSRGVLERFYKTFRRNFADDPRGREALAEAFPGLEPDELDREFQRWVAALDAPAK